MAEKLTKSERRTLAKAMYIQTAAKLADPDCTECGGTGICGWGLRKGGGFTWSFPCIRCRHSEYVECAERMAEKYGSAANAP